MCLCSLFRSPFTPLFVGKFIIGYVPTCGVKEYYIGSACEELYAPPSAYVGLYGFLVQASFLGGELLTLSCERIFFVFTTVKSI